MSVQIGRRQATGLCLGSRSVSRAYLGDRLVFGGGEREPTRLYFTLTDELTQPIYFTQSAEHGVTVDWGDGSAPETYAANSTATAVSGAAMNWVTASHTYGATGDYVVCLTAAEGVTWFPGSGPGIAYPWGMVGKYNYSNLVFPTLTGVTFGDGATLTGSFYAFCHCTGLTEIQLPAGDAVLPQGTFFGCSNLVSVGVPPSMTGFNRWAFYRCPKLQMAQIPASITSIGFAAFLECTSLTISEVPAHVAELGAYAFQGCTGLSNVEIACDQMGSTVTVTSTESYDVSSAFNKCTALKAVWIRKSCRRIYATESYPGFRNCPEDLKIYVEADGPQAGWDEYWNYIDKNTPITPVYGQTACPW